MQHDPVNPQEGEPGAAERAWWKSLRLESADCPGAPDPAALAGWIDGRLEPKQADLLEDHLAECSSCRRAVVEVAETIHALDPVSTAPPEVVRRAVSLMVGDHSLPGPGHPRLAATRWPLAAAAAIAACLLGYAVGSAAFVDRSAAEDPVLAEMTFGMFGADGEGGELLPLVLSEMRP